MGEALDIRVRYRPVIEIRGIPAVDEEVASILEALREKGSLLSASKSLGIPYSRAWERISRIENISGRRVVETRRGGRRGGGSALTSFGEYLLTLYRIALSRLEEKGLAAPITPGALGGELVVAHSSDPLLSLILERLASQGIPVRGVCIGSGLSLAMLSLGEADVACTHLYDPTQESITRHILRSSGSRAGLRGSAGTIESLSSHSGEGWELAGSKMLWRGCSRDYTGSLRGTGARGPGCIWSTS